ncbi:DUF5685 family protein [Actinoallomurus soli]|uniref:DUF5685 family protein n=1 Tax=Actinoallomurus soli TaxID=2952535 RepID=UPI002092591E|nr:DUF5685 family protein [Actinoallomurus soli]MCO5967775.1 DUF5685 family protein [Actinoallomurus soli]
MFGIVRPCRHVMCAPLFKDWMAHLCGLCLALRDEHGQAARLVTNYDGLLISVLVEAQNPERSPHRTAGPCALRGMRTADVVASHAEGARLAAATSLLLAAGKTRDHVADRDGAHARRLVAATAGWMAGRWDAAGARTGAAVGLDPGVLRDTVARQTALETTTGLGLLELTEPTETAVAVAFAHTAVVAGTPRNAETLAEAGRFFGRLAHLLDAVEDYEADRASGAFNPLRATGTSLAEARRHCDDAVRGLHLALGDLELERPRLVRALLGREVRRSVDRAFAAYDPAAYGPSGPPDPYGPRHPYGPGPHDPHGPRHPYGPGPQSPPPSWPGHGPHGPGRPPTRPGFGLACLAGSLVGCTCGLYRPPWSDYRGAGCGDRCWCSRACDDCDCCDCCSCCECCDCDCCDCDGDCCDCDCG